jgi:hypothetical protein
MKRYMTKVLPFVFLAALAFGQSLPSVWVDNNEATDGSVESYTITSGGTGCVAGNLHISAPPTGGTQARGTYTCTSGVLTGVTITNPGLGYKTSPTARLATGTGTLTLFVYKPPTFELQLGTSTGSWVKGPPPGCTFTLANYVTTATGKQNAINDIEACRKAKGVGLILDVPPVSSQSLGRYSSAQGVLIPQTSNQPATEFIVIRSTMDSTLAGLPEPVCAGGVQDNLSTSANIGLINPDCSGDAMAYQLGTTITSIPSGPFTLANGNATNTSSYNYVQYMYQDECTGTNCIALRFCSVVTGSADPCTGTTFGPDHWLFEDGAASMSANNNGNNDIVNTGTGSPANASLAQFADHIHFRRYWVHGDWTSLTAGSNAISTALSLNQCATCSVVGSQVSQALRPGGEGHSVLANGTNYKFANDWLEGSSTCIFSGGFGTLNVSPNFSYVPFQDVQIGRVRCTFPYSWLGVTNPTCAQPNGTVPPGNPYWGCVSIVRKNCDEMKEGERILIYGLICENVDNSGGQNGTVSTINIRNRSGGGIGENYQATINDLTIVNSIFRNSCWGIELAARSSSAAGNGGGVSFPMKRVAFLNDLQYNISGSNPGCPGTKIGMQMSSAGQSWRGTITENSAGTAATFVATCSVDGGDCPGGPPSVGFEVMDISAGDPIAISGCTTVTAFNVSTHIVSGKTVPVGIGAQPLNPLVSVGSAAWTGGFTSAGVTVTYPWVAAPNTVDNSGTCTLTNIEGGPQNVNIQHHTFITDANQTIGNGNTASNGPNFQINHAFENSILLSSGATSAGWYNSVVGEGTPTEDFNYDYTSMTAYKLVWPGRTNTKYTEYGNAPGYPDPNGCTGAGCTPPNSTGWYFPATSYCTGPTPTSACVGFVGAMNTSSMPLTLLDYHGYGLLSTSTLHNQASDGTDIGTIIPSLDTAQTTTQYVCTGSCGTIGPYPD